MTSKMPPDIHGLTRNSGGTAPLPGSLALEVRKVSKRFGGETALSRASLRVGRGEIHGLVGENGSGKSTLVKILAGVHSPERGARIRCWGEDVALPVRSPQRHGIAVIHQDLGLVPEMSVLENLGVSTSYGTRGLRPVRWKTERRAAAASLERLGVELPLGAPVGTLSPAERAFVAVARAARVLAEHSASSLFVLDEPTTYLATDEAQRVLDLMRQVASRGDSVIFISHYLHEVLSTCHKATVLRDGEVVGSMDVSRLSESELIGLMLGRKMLDFYPPPPDWRPGEVELSIRGMEGEVVRDFSLELRSGEIVGVTGVTGAGHQEIPYLVTGVRPSRAGSVVVRGWGRLEGGPGSAADAGVVLVPSNRQTDGLWLAASAGENITLPVLRDYFRGGLIRLGEERNEAAALMRRHLVAPSDPTREAYSFSGGNQQKIVVAKWMQGRPRILLLDEPTQGVDVGARREILEIIRERVRGGSAALIASSDHEQLAATCNRVVVLRDGLVVGRLRDGEVSERAILDLCHASSGPPEGEK
ncbi:MAG: sugar ABC transporter ATP-binding protein [Actinomycetota bacterium]